MLLVDELISEGEAEASTVAQAELHQAERTWEVAPGSIAPAQAEEPRTIFALAPA
jgi:hypothetical protein